MPQTPFSKPKWQHRDPDVRRRAVQELDAGDTETLARVACDDESPGVRRSALRRIDNLDLIHRISNDDKDREVRLFTRTRLSKLLAGTSERSPALAVRMDFLARHPDADLLDFVALHGLEPELRRAVQDRVTRAATLGDIAVKDALPAHREAALQRISDPAVLEGVLRQTRGRDAEVHALARKRLEALREAQERPARVKAECDRICTAMQTLGSSGDWQEELLRLRLYENHWRLLADAAEPAQLARYSAAHAAFMQASADYRMAQEQRAQERAAALARRQTLLSEVQQRRAQLSDPQAPADDAAQTMAELASWQAAWADADDLPSAQAEPLERRFQHEIDAMRAHLKAAQIDTRMQEALAALLADAEQMLNSKHPVRETEVKALEKRRAQQSRPGAAGHPAEHLQQCDGLLRKLRKRLERQRRQRATQLQRLPDMLEQLAALLNQQALQAAAPLHDRIQSCIRHLQALGVAPDQLTPYTGRLHSLTPQIRELQSWRSWGAGEARERLCAEMEALIDCGKEPGELAGEIRRRRKDWDELQTDGGAGVQALRRRFDRAASRAYEPCAVFFRQQAVERGRNLEEKHALLGRLGDFLATADWSRMDWKAAVSFQRRLADDWRRAGPVDRRKLKALEGRYREGMQLLNAKLKAERTRNLAERKALIEQVRGLQNSDDVGQAIDACKQLQTRWQTTVPAKRAEENRLWEAFREACDAVFMRRKQQQDQRRSTEQRNKAEKLGLCDQAQALTRLGPDELADARRRLKRIREQWSAVGPVPARDRQALEEGFRNAQRDFQARVTALQTQVARAQLDLLQEKAGCCMAVEQFLEAPDAAAARAGLEALDARWTQLPILEDAAREQLIRLRYQKARDALLTGGEQLERLLGELQANLEQRKSMCLKMEILCGAASPPGEQAARMQFQASRLAETIGQGVADPVGNKADLEYDWYLSGCAPCDQEQALQARFEKARRTGDQAD